MAEYLPLLAALSEIGHEVLSGNWVPTARELGGLISSLNPAKHMPASHLGVSLRAMRTTLLSLRAKLQLKASANAGEFSGRLIRMELVQTVLRARRTNSPMEFKRLAVRNALTPLEVRVIVKVGFPPSEALSTLALSADMDTLFALIEEAVQNETRPRAHGAAVGKGNRQFQRSGTGGRARLPPAASARPGPVPPSRPALAKPAAPVVAPPAQAVAADGGAPEPME